MRGPYSSEGCVCVRAGLVGSSSLEQARVHMLVDTFEDMWSGSRNCLLLPARVPYFAPASRHSLLPSIPSSITSFIARS